MRITGLKVDGFGVWSNLELTELSDQLTVFYGPNEAGKTTLMQFVRSVLYGFSAQRRARYLPPLGGGRPGGTIQALAAQDRFAISRHADGSQPNEPAVLVAGRQAADNEQRLAQLLGGVDEPTFNNVYAFGLREIQELGTLSDTQAADELYSLALGLDRVSLVGVLDELETSRNRLLAVDDRPSLVTQLVSQRERLREEIADLGHATTRYLTLTAQRGSLEAEIAQLETDHAQREQQAREVALARALSARWQRRAAIDGQLQGLGTFDGLPEGALARYERFGSRIAARRRRYRRLAQERLELGGEIEKLAINESLCRLAPRFEALAEQQHWIRGLESQVARLEEELLELESRREEHSKQWGADSSSGGAAAGPLAKRDLASLRSAARALRDARREFRLLKTRAESSEQSAADLVRQAGVAPGAASGKSLTQALGEAGELVSQLRRRVQLDERLDQMSRRETQLDEQSHEHLENQILPTWALAGLGSLFVLGCALVLLYVAGLVLPASLSSALGWPVGLIGVMAAGAAGAIKFGMERSATAQLETCHTQIHSLKEQIKQARAERDQLDQQLPRGGGPLVARLQAAETSMAQLEGLLPLEARRDDAQRAAAAAREKEEAARENCQALRKKWRRLLAERGLRVDLKPSGLRAYARRRDEWRSLSKLVDEKSGELARARMEYEALANRIEQLVAEAGAVPPGGRPLDALARCLTELGDQRKRLKHRNALARQSARLARKQRQLVRQARRLRGRRQLLLRAAGAFDEQDFRRRTAAQAEAERLRSERAGLEHEIAATIAGTCSEQRLAEQFTNEGNLEQLEHELNEGRRHARERLNATVEKRGETNEQLKTLVENRQLAHMRIELSIVEKQLADALDRWRVLAVCGLVLSAVREYYEREHQPQALREASVHLRRLTSGRYTRVWTPVGENSLRVDDSQGGRLGVDVLSRGTREQLFLALRLALVSGFARRGVSLPLVLDDVLVNFDVGRAKAAAAVLRDFARDTQHQVLVFTCHEHIARLFRNLKADVRQLPDNAQPRAEAIDSSPAKRARRGKQESPAEPQVEPEVLPQLEEFEPIDVFAPSVPPMADPLVTETPPIPEPTQAPEAPPTLPPKRPTTSPPPRQLPDAPPATTQRRRWSAEEFDGELTDRVRRPQAAEGWDREVHSDFDDPFAAGDDAEAA